MKLLFITREDRRLSGARVRCYNFARRLAELGWETEVFSFPERLGAKCAEEEFKMPLRAKLGYNLEAFRRLIKENKDCVFYLQRFNYHALAPLMASLLKKNRVVFDCDDWNIRENPVYHLGLFPSSKMEYATRQTAKYSRSCIAASVFLQDYLSRFNKKTYYIPTGVDTGLFSPSPRTENPKVVFSWIGTVYHPQMKENLDFILDCFSELAGSLDNIYLSLLGEGKYYDLMRKDSGSLRYAKRITFGSWIDPDFIPEYLSGIDIGLLPLIQDSYFNKAKSPTKLFEYMSMAKPTVSSRIGEAENVIADGETGYIARGREEFISRMRRLAEDPRLRQNMGQKARLEAEKNYSLEVLAGRLAAILRDI